VRNLIGKRLLGNREGDGRITLRWILGR